MKINVRETVVVELELTEDEAQRLKHFVQNQLTEVESQQDLLMREAFFQSIGQQRNLIMNNMNSFNQSPAIGWVQDSQGKMLRYDDFVSKLFKKDAACGDLMHAVIGICGEAGELADAIKKHVVYNKPLDHANVIEELGDLRFYMQALQNLLGISEQRILQHNFMKLAQRYEGLEYSDEAAQARKDKQELSHRAVDDTAGLEDGPAGY